jgi:hypothetical protein
MLPVDQHVENILILGAGELGMAVLNAMAKKVQQHPLIKISVLLRSEAAHATSGPLKNPGWMRCKS